MDTRDGDAKGLRAGEGDVNDRLRDNFPRVWRYDCGHQTPGARRE